MLQFLALVKPPGNSTPLEAIIVELFWESFWMYFWIIFETSFSNPFRSAFGFVLGPSGDSKQQQKTFRGSAISRFYSGSFSEAVWEGVLEAR